jgi:endonuclease/exonuclease/phosphatase family metal-dependent hydrolase
MDADVILLQEVDRFCRRSEHRDVAQQLAERLGMSWVSGGEFQEIGEGTRAQACVTGQAILARSSIQDAAVVRFEDQASAKWRFNPAQPRRGGRIALRATVDGMVVYSLHLESGGGSSDLRASQLDDLLEDARGQRDRPVMIAGDFNAAMGEAPGMVGRLTRDGFVDLVDGTGAVARRPIDWVLARAVRGTASVVRADGASDHDPLIITLAKVAETR